MIPIRDTIGSKNYPIVNSVIIGFNILLYLVQMAQGDHLHRFIYIYGLVPARYTVPTIADYFTLKQQIFSLISFMFLHGGFWHLLSNMWFLYIFGDNVEDRLGHLRYLLFYLLCGLASGLCHLLVNFDSPTPTIGASGAIAGVMGAYFILHPGARILTLIPILIIPWFVEIPAFFFLGFWFFIQFVNAVGTPGEITGIAWWAHIGGFVSGILFMKAFGKIPSAAFGERMRQATLKKTSPRLQVVYPTTRENDLDRYGTILITPHEALHGTHKLINISWGFQKRLFRVSVPAGTKDGSMLRLKGMGRQSNGGESGDMYLKVKISG